MFLGKRLKELRKVKGLTQDELGELVNVTKVSICCYERGSRTPTLETLVDLANVFDVEVNYLLGFDKHIVADNRSEYGMRVSLEEMNLLKELRKHNDLHVKLTDDPKRMLDYFDKQIR